MATPEHINTVSDECLLQSDNCKMSNALTCLTKTKSIDKSEILVPIFCVYLPYLRKHMIYVPYSSDYYFIV